jgi:hypothetical protein
LERMSRLRGLLQRWRDAFRLPRELYLVLLVFLGLLGIFCVLRWWYGKPLETEVRFFDILLKIASITAIAVGAVWSYNAFLRQRLSYPRLTVKQEIKSVRLSDGRHLLKVQVTVSNIGQVQVILQRWNLHAEQILPLTGDVVSKDLPKGAYTDQDANWLCLAKGEFSGKQFEMLLEPGESDQAIGNLVIPADVEVVQVYSHLWTRADGVSVKGVPSGWPCQDIVDLRLTGIETPKEKGQ